MEISIAGNISSRAKKVCSQNRERVSVKSEIK